MSLFGPKCVHEWEQVDKHVFKSAYELMTEDRTAERITKGGPWMFKRKIVWLLRCKHCTEHKTITEEFDPW